MAGFAFTTVALLWALVTGDQWGLCPFAVVFGFGWGAQAVLRLTVASETFGLLSIGLLQGVLGFSEAIASALGSSLSGLFFDLTGSYDLACLIAIPISVAGAQTDELGKLGGRQASRVRSVRFRRLVCFSAGPWLGAWEPTTDKEVPSRRRQTVVSNVARHRETESSKVPR